MPNPMDWKQALQMLIPAAGAAIGGGQAGLGGFATGYSRGRMAFDQASNQEGYLNLAQSRDTYGRQRDLVEDQWRQDTLKREQAARWIKVLEQVPQLREQAFNLAEESGAITPEQATAHASQTMNDWMSSIGKLLPGGDQIDPMTMARMAAVTPQHASVRFQKQWADEYRALTKGLNDTQLAALRANPAPLVSPATGRQWPMPFAEMEKRLGVSGLPAMKQQSYQSKNVKGVLPSGAYFEGMANFDPEQGKYFVDGEELRNVRDAPAAPTVQVNTGGNLPSKVQSQVNQKVRAYEGNATVKNTQLIAESLAFVNALDPKTSNPADDQALIYAFAKAMDPNSVVREGEYAVVQKYSQSWAEKFGFDAARVVANIAFLTPEARANIKRTIQSKATSVLGQYRTIRSQYTNQINKLTGGTDGADWLIDYTEMLAPGERDPEGTRGGRAALKSRLGGAK